MLEKCFSVVAILFFASNCFGQQGRPDPAQEKISEQSVTETIKFLASDELQGRDTPSPGLDKASDFVAERFKTAGLGTAWHQRYIFPNHHQSDGSSTTFCGFDE